jgi:DNA polymerase delta subunit 2
VTKKAEYLVGKPKMTLIRDLDETKYQNLSDRFYIKEKNFSYQYAPLYSERLTAMKNDIKNACLKKWSNKYPIKGLVDLEKDEKCIIIGTLYKEMKLKSNILKELAEDENNGMIMQPVVHRGRYIDESDQLILEDELQRILLVDSKDSKCDFIVSKNKLCTGLVIALLGVENEQSQFEVEDICFKQTPIIELKEKKFTDDKYIVFMSGIELGDEKTNENLYKFQLFIDFLGGDFVNLNEKSTDYENRIKNMLKNTIRLIIAGNSLASTTQSKDMHQKAKYLTKNFIKYDTNNK